MNDDRAAIEAGMEMLRWDVGAEWVREGGVYVKQPDISREGCGGILAITCGIFASLGVLFAGMALWMETIGPWGVLLLCLATAVTTLGGYLTYRSRRPVRLLGPSAGRPDRVRFTSTGLLVGEHARLWHSDRYRLSGVAVVHGRLVVDFGRSGFFKLPIPDGLESDVEEMAKLLQAKLGATPDQELPETPRPDDD